MASRPDLEIKRGATPPNTPVSESPRGSESRSSLGKTSGLVAAGAWAARMELANLLESRCDPLVLVEEIRRGKEGRHELRLDGSLVNEPVLEPTSPVSATERSRSPQPKRDHLEGLPKDLFGGQDLDEIIQDQKAILKALKSDSEPMAPWAAKAITGAVPGAVRSLEMSPVEPSFGRKAKAPPSGVEISVPSKRKHPSMSYEAKASEEEAFGKKATPPPRDFHQDPKKTKGMADQKPSERHGVSHSVLGREKEDLETFAKEAISIFEDMEVVGVAMDLVKYVRSGKGVDKEKFLLHTSPNRASTGLRYVRVMKGLLSWAEEFDPLPKGVDVPPLERLRVVEYVELLIQKGVGFYTPQTLLFAVDYFGKAFGFDPTGAAWVRAKRLAVKYAKSKPGLTNRAALFGKSTLLALEEIVLDESCQIVDRVVAGKLRLCVQASVRWDDLLHTPMANLEWVRRRGESSIVAIRAKSTQGKNKARPWIASLMGVAPEHDRWLVRLVELLVEIHGQRWAEDDHCGKEVARDGEGFTVKPARIGNDVMAVKGALAQFKENGGDPGLSCQEISLLRWHGAKASFTSLMQHLSLDPKTVRLSGDWSLKDESMADTYLREAQILVLNGQEVCLNYLRSGGDFGGLVAEGLAGSGHPGKETAPRDPRGESLDETSEPVENPEDEARKKEALRGASKFEGVPPPEVDPCFLEKNILAEGKVPSKMLEEEMMFEFERDKLEQFLEENDPSQDVFVELEFDRKPHSSAVKTEPLDGETGGASGVVEPGTSQEAPDPPLQDEEYDREGLTTRFVLTDKATAASRLHLPMMGPGGEDFPVVATPKCGVKGTFTYIQAGEAIDPGSEPCARCFGRRSEGACRKLCSLKTVVDGVESRCTRRCSVNCQGASVHLCHVHGY